MSPIDLAALLEEELDELPQAAIQPSLPAEGPPLARSFSDDDWQEDPIPVKLDKIRAAFLNSRTAGEVRALASTMMIGDWLEFVVKLSPKNIQVQADISFKHMLAELGPIDKDAYRVPVIDVECKQLT